MVVLIVGENDVEGRRRFETRDANVSMFRTKRDSRNLSLQDRCSKRVPSDVYAMR